MWTLVFWRWRAALKPMSDGPARRAEGDGCGRARMAFCDDEASRRRPSDGAALGVCARASASRPSDGI